MTPEIQSAAMEQMLRKSITFRIGQLAGFVFDETGGVVQNGPFAGMQLLKDIVWGTGDIPAKLLGTYEQELRPAIEYAIERKPQVVFNVGCAEGYYAVGLARRLPRATVVAVDTIPEARLITQRAARENGISLVTTGSIFEPESLDFLKHKNGQYEHGLVVMDVEGAELEILSPEMIARMGTVDVIVECHDFIDETIKSQLMERFRETHDVVVYTEGARDPNIAPIDGLSSLDRWLCVSENRPQMMQWLACWSKVR